MYFIIVCYQAKLIFLLSKYLPFNPSIIWDSSVSSDIYVRVCLHKGNNILPSSEESYKGKVKTHKYIDRQNPSTTGKLWKR